jgi:hypothetical protein
MILIGGGKILCHFQHYQLKIHLKCHLCLDCTKYIVLIFSFRVLTLLGQLLLLDHGELEVGLMKPLNQESKWPNSGMHQ